MYRFNIYQVLTFIKIVSMEHESKLVKNGFHFFDIYTILIILRNKCYRIESNKVVTNTVQSISLNCKNLLYYNIIQLLFQLIHLFLITFFCAWNRLINIII